MGNKLLSVVIPTRNRCEQLARAITSVQQQDWPDIEIIVVDDASNDNTPQYLEELSRSCSNIIYITNRQPVGGAKARNQGIGLAQGFYTAFLDDDDIWLPQKSRMQIESLVSNKKLSAVTCDFKIIYSGLPITRIKKISRSSSSNDIYAFNFLGGASMCLTYTHLLLEVGGVNENLLSCQDWDLWLKLAQLGDIGRVDEVLVYYYSHKSERISSKLSNVYSGRVNIYFNYREKMTDIVRKQNVAAILFIRIMMRTDSIVNKLNRLKMLYGGTKFRMFLIYIRIITLMHFRTIFSGPIFK